MRTASVTHSQVLRRLEDDGSHYYGSLVPHTECGTEANNGICRPHLFVFVMHTSIRDSPNNVLKKFEGGGAARPPLHPSDPKMRCLRP